MRLDLPFVLGIATSSSALWSVTYYTAIDCSGPGKEIGGFEAGCRTLETGTNSVMVSTDDGNNITLSTGINCDSPYEDLILNEVTDRCVNAAIRSFLSY
ncbi:hypothetical protein DTO027I6_7852 [Penicillium roqueforti]|jgi:hypothetical protein|uniref:uncharacterized protein n=1 Tax=Penicillium roqueforti TaxID=5082 RepID=UPI00190C1269|nr:uncharacterized protein LCP9604111_9544 [Penicillium roqueforti]KAF9238185.1 hypothetical protein LCP9604111_9544 [Penicillium roqueforti]KAI2678823.1 hypothetical protein CBS147355_4708 [Penicillium roqueforti]KAI2709356.1 hypothetical protein CBS147318_9167 [Penicillium roqueforti]KAI2736065.1 hypothetical protein DTO013F2_10029 [Penicillium roqueforti]KAI3143121.1 hypothetical protein CBS147330_908 [Penicillium roqueforti]